MESVRSKLAILADAAKYDASCASSGARRPARAGALGDSSGMGICHSYTPDGRCVSLLKILLTNHCVYDCQFCVNRASSDVPRARFSIDEVVGLTLEFYRRNYIEGLFLSSGIIRSPDYTMEQLVAVGRSLRMEHQYNGYLHLKAVPGASPELLAAAGRYADRLSANIELPTAADLKRLAPEKTQSTIHQSMVEIKSHLDEARDASKPGRPHPQFAPAGQTTQMVVGATPTPDAAILSAASELYSRFKLRRIYYSAYSPIPASDPRLPPRPPPLVREHRLYQSDWLMRHYGFDAKELTTPEAPNLDLSIDPKLAWALRHREFFPVDLNKAPRWKLLRIPGIGARNVERILNLRRLHSIRMNDLAKLRVSLRKVRPFVIAADHNPDAHRIDRPDLCARLIAPHRQLELFETLQSAVTGEV